ncbi:hypothetical protein H257_15513 [Aphanomyces astaci]|uniref:Uncharacterized protein n=1 Tax=Aphanomyces astaci TaxID=112090 RepID=W4FM12_APHAT|nr:hypothetical protein H257_15513 [Aphanomyces astaci]ETV68515.1 hypothetical protein H257_15513 [Aphanomyces astaci]|eukprot:XP_009841944.1 hypothetical protein H257_15513 [Aphanomyces astaci]
MARYQRMASEKKRKRAETQRRYRLSREGRIAMTQIALVSRHTVAKVFSVFINCAFCK